MTNMYLFLKTKMYTFETAWENPKYTEEFTFLAFFLPKDNLFFVIYSPSCEAIITVFMVSLSTEQFKLSSLLSCDKCLLWPANILHRKTPSPAAVTEWGASTQEDQPHRCVLLKTRALKGTASDAPRISPSGPGNPGCFKVAGPQSKRNQKQVASRHCHPAGPKSLMGYFTKPISPALFSRPVLILLTFMVSVHPSCLYSKVVLLLMRE